MQHNGADLRETMARKEVEKAMEQAAHNLRDQVAKDDPAHPFQVSMQGPGGTIGAYDAGLSKLDMFAAHALTGLLANPGAAGHLDGLPALAYEQAKIMLAERSKIRAEAKAKKNAAPVEVKPE